MAEPRIEFECGDCGKTVRFDAPASGSVQQCPECGSYLDVPAIAGSPLGPDPEKDRYEEQWEEPARQLEINKRQSEQVQRQLDWQDEFDSRKQRMMDRAEDLLQRWETLANRFEKVLQRFEETG
jgi:DNA-directed RNA polymerase subunit RPC12/RpoP